MKRSFFITCIAMSILLMAGCDGKEKEAMLRLANAKAMYERNETMAAKNEIDTIRKYYPEEVKVMKETLLLLWKIELKEAERNMAYCDSLLPLRQAEAVALAKDFILEKNEYQAAGAYIHKQQTIERNVERSYIRCSVSETGELTLVSVYFGSAPINHTAIRISARSGLFASTVPIPHDGGQNYRFKDMGYTSEIVSYKGDRCTDAVNFICSNQKERLKVDYSGGKSYSIYMDENSKKAVLAASELAVALSDVSRLSKERNIAADKIAWLAEKLSPASL
ncbi:MAG: hypothetical protein LBD28_01705 [Tannerellaceae bacterium]|nr:hypothetical protein [Tannerellaceae bacterium]